MMGGSDKILAKGRELQAQGKYLESVEILNKLVFAEPRNQPARDLLADAYEQLGYQMESTSLRNSFLQGAYELRSGMPTGTAPSTGSADVIRSMPTGYWLDFLGISMDPKRAEGLNLSINLVLPDISEQYLIELSNATLTNIEGVQAAEPDLTLTLDRADLNRVMLGVATFDSLAEEGRARFDGDRTAIYKLRDLMVSFTPDFEFIPGSAPEQRQVPPGRPFVVPDPTPALSAE
jgi:alkyl sulfatase BDS1-like metallo-beta-lactamase superfamily hydrolase